MRMERRLRQGHAVSQFDLPYQYFSGQTTFNGELLADQLMLLKVTKAMPTRTDEERVAFLKAITVRSSPKRKPAQDIVRSFDRTDGRTAGPEGRIGTSKDAARNCATRDVDYGFKSSNLGIKEQLFSHVNR